jgi:hypothetical protein
MLWAHFLAVSSTPSECSTKNIKRDSLVSVMERHRSLGAT